MFRVHSAVYVQKVMNEHGVAATYRKFKTQLNQKVIVRLHFTPVGQYFVVNPGM